MKQDIDFEKARRIAVSTIREWCPGFDSGKPKGAEWWFSSPLRNDQHPTNFSVNLEKGVFCDLADPSASGSILDLYAKMNGKTILESAKDMLSIPNYEPYMAGNTIKPPESSVKYSSPDLPPAKPGWTSVDRYENDSCLFYDYRYDPPNGKKYFSPWYFDGSKWVNEKPPRPTAGYPLANLDKIKTGSVHVITEGSMDGRAIPPPFIAITWAGGANSYQTYDWTPLKGLDVVLWPDNDDPGRLCMDGIEAILKPIVKTLKRIDPPGWLPPKAGAADVDNPAEIIATARTISKPRKEFPLKKYGDAEILPPQWLIKGLFEQDSTSCLFGASGSGKSYLALSAACSVATGADFFGHPVKKPGAVVYVAGEGFNGIAKRIKAWEIKNETPVGPAPLYISEASARLCDDQFMVKVNETIAEVSEIESGISLLIIDTWARNMFGNENDTADTSKAIDALDRIRNQYKCTVIIIHHTGQAESERARGSSALRAALDTEFQISNKNDILTMKNTKMKDGTAPEDMLFDFQYVDIGMVDEDGEPVYSSIISPACQGLEPKEQGKGKVQTEIERLLIGNHDGIPRKDFRQLLIKSGLKPVSVDKALKQYRDSGKIIIKNEYYFWSETVKTPYQGDIF